MAGLPPRPQRPVPFWRLYGECSLPLAPPPTPRKQHGEGEDQSERDHVQEPWPPPTARRLPGRSVLKTEQPAEAKAALEEPVEAKAVETMPPTTFRATTLSYVLSRCAPPPTTLPSTALAPPTVASTTQRQRLGAVLYFVGHGENRRFFRVRRAPPPSPGGAYVLVELHEGRPSNVLHENRWT